MHHKTHMDLQYTAMGLHKIIKQQNSSEIPVQSPALNSQRTMVCLQSYSPQGSANPTCQRRNLQIVSILSTKGTRTQQQTSRRNQQPTKRQKKTAETVAV
jgi:hypothetical protein